MLETDILNIKLPRSLQLYSIYASQIFPKELHVRSGAREDTTTRYLWVGDNFMVLPVTESPLEMWNYT
jgi:hypothetical protein